ncbi:MAG: hypothetical protein ACKVUS_12110 [Saprospiraceae bacterium]
MKKQLIATLVGAAILFVWQFLSWSTLGIHESEYGYTPNQDRIMEALGQNLTEEGTYMLPGVPPGTSHEQAEALMQPNVGKPWASITYHKAFNMDMGMNMLRGFAVDLLAAWLLVWLLMKFQSLNMMTALQSSIAVGVIGYLTIPYLNSIWFDGNSIGHLVDAVASWGIVGLWLGWWLPRK